MLLCDFHSQRWTTLAQAESSYSPLLFWSRDSKYVYAQDADAAEQPVLRVRLSDYKMEAIATLQQFARADAKSYALSGLAPDSSPLASLLRSQDEIYALDVDFP